VAAVAAEETSDLLVLQLAAAEQVQQAEQMDQMEQIIQAAVAVAVL
jgi:hypothetical protein